MSSILKALKKLESEREKPTVEIAGQVTQYEEKPPASNSLRPVLLLIGGVVLGGVVVGGWLYWQAGPQNSAPENLLASAPVASQTSPTSAAPEAAKPEQTKVETVVAEARTSTERHVAAAEAVVPTLDKTLPAVPAQVEKKTLPVSSTLTNVPATLVAEKPALSGGQEASAPGLAEVAPSMPEAVAPVVDAATVAKVVAPEPSAGAIRRQEVAVSDLNASPNAAEPLVKEVRIAEEEVARVDAGAQTAAVAAEEVSAQPAEPVEPADVILEPNDPTEIVAPVVNETTAPVETATQREAEPIAAFTGLEVTDIFFNPDGGSLAVVDDLPVMEGTVIDGVLVEEILADKVKFNVDGAVIVIPFKADSAK